MSNNNGLTNKAVYDLIDRQLAVWQQASDNFSALANVGVKEITVDCGRMLKRIQPAPQGRAHRIRKRSNHITLFVDTKND